MTSMTSQPLVTKDGDGAIAGVGSSGSSRTNITRTAPARDTGGNGGVMPPSPTSLPAVSNKGGGASPPPASKKEASSSTQRALDREKAKADKKVAQLANERRIMMVRGRGRGEGEPGGRR